MFEIIIYSPEHYQEWNDFVAKSKNGTFLFDRNYMDYHSDRFEDFSLLFYLAGKLFAIFPANKDCGILKSHGGLTYGGLIMNEKVTAEKVCILFQELKAFLKSQGFTSILYKCVPHIYHHQPAEEDLYALFKECDARLYSRCISSTIQIQEPIKWRYSRKYELNKARKAGVVVEEAVRSEDYIDFWQILTVNLRSAHGVSPVHSLAEMSKLQNCFPNNIRLFVAKKNDIILAGILVYLTDNVVHTQYISASPEGKQCGAIDIILHTLLCSDILFAGNGTIPRYLDFGHSTENQGRLLNTGLIHQKEGFGARAVCYDTYFVKL